MVERFRPSGPAASSDRASRSSSTGRAGRWARRSPLARRARGTSKGFLIRSAPYVVNSRVVDKSAWLRMERRCGKELIVTDFGEADHADPRKQRSAGVIGGVPGPWKRWWARLNGCRPTKIRRIQVVWLQRVPTQAPIVRHLIQTPEN